MPNKRINHFKCATQICKQNWGRCKPNWLPSTSLDTVLHTRVTALEQEHQEFLDEGNTLQAQFKELQYQKAPLIDTVLVGHLQLADLEIARLRKQVQWEANFSQRQVSEVDRLGQEVKQLQSEIDQLWGELKCIKDAQTPMALPQATYPLAPGTGVSPGQQYGSPVPSNAAIFGQFSPNLMQYGIAARQAASHSQVGQALSYGYPPLQLTHQYQGSLQQQGGIAMFRPSAGLQQGPSVAQGTEAQSPAVVTPPTTTSASSN